MRLKKGSKVEIWNMREVPSGSWWSAEIVSGNGHNYYVKYDVCSSDIGAVVERVPRKAIRPCPPVESSRSWLSGDILEVFNNNSWKLAEVSRVVGGNHIFVRLLGSSWEFRAHISDLRLRQSWQDNKWVVIRKDSGRSIDGMTKPSKEGKFSHRTRPSCIEMKNYAGDIEFLIENDCGFDEPNLVSSMGMKKRPLFYLPPAESCTGADGRMRAVRKEQKRQQLEKVDAVVSPQIMLGEKYMHASLNNVTTGFSVMDKGWGKPNAEARFCFSRSLDANDAECSSSSVGSCSPSNSPYRSFYHPVTCATQDINSHSDNSESFSGSGRELSLPTQELSTEEIHKLELHAYRSTMDALYASGPLSWGQEALLTNLRLMLHISNDEHLWELRLLVSSKIDIPSSLLRAIPS